MNAINPKDFFKQYSQYLSKLLQGLNFDSIQAVADIIIRQSKRGKTVYFMGNGGSASTASHFATDLVHCGLLDHRPIIRAVSISDNIALITAIGNDKGYEYVFSRQLESLAKRGDICVAISASGNSRNLIEAFKTSKLMGIITVALLGFDGGKLMKMADHVIHVKTPKGEYGPVEDSHLFLDHMISSYIGVILNSEK